MPSFFIAFMCFRRHNIVRTNKGFIMQKIISGDSQGFTFSILYAGSVDGKEKPDLSAADVVFAIKKNSEDPDNKALVYKTVSAPDSNIVYFEITPEESARLKPGTYPACCKIYYNSGSAVTVWLDTIMVTKGVLGAR